MASKTSQYKRLIKRLEEIKQEKKHLFLGTTARYIVESDQHPGSMNIMLVWRSTMMPDDVTREQELDEFRPALADVLEWNTAQYGTGRVVMHT